MLSKPQYIIELIAIMIVVFVVYHYLKDKIISVLKSKIWYKWVMLGVVIILSALYLYAGSKFGAASLQSDVMIGIMIFAFLIVLDLFGWTKTYDKSKSKSKDKKDDIIIREKAKPNRVKKLNKDDK